MIVAKRFKFEASHQLQHDEGKCSRLHGHSWELAVYIDGERDENGIVKNYRDIKADLEPMIEGLDHWHLGFDNNSSFDLDHKGTYTTSPVVIEYIRRVLPGTDFSDFEPTSENLLYVIAWWIESHTTLSWHSLTLAETCTTQAILTHYEYHQQKKGEYTNARQTVQQEGKGGNEEGQEGEENQQEEVNGLELLG